MMLRFLGAQWLAAAFVGVISFAVSVLIAREGGSYIFGEYTLALSVGSMLAVLIDGGMKHLLIRERARASARLVHLSDSLFSMAVGQAFLVALALTLLGCIMYPEKVILVLATIWCFFCIVVTQYISAVLRGDGRLLSDAAWQMGHRTLSATFIALAISLGFNSSWQILSVWALATLVASLIFFVNFEWRPIFSIRHGLFKVLFPLLWIDLASAVYFRADLIILKWLGVPLEKIGLYSAAYRLLEVFIILSAAVGLLLFRHIRLMTLDRIALCQKVWCATLLATILGVALALILYFLSESFVVLAFGPEYAEAVHLLAILAWSLIFLLPNVVLTQAALALELERPYALAATIAAIFNVTMNFLFVESYGLYAPAIVTIGTEAILFACLILVFYKHFKIYVLSSE
jgi:O-antigen/teichoic acid export membrane protein